MTEDRKGENAPLNPDLRKSTDHSHDPAPTPPPLESTGAHEGSQGEGWPIVWLVVTVVSIILAIYYLA